MKKNTHTIFTIIVAITIVLLTVNKITGNSFSLSDNQPSTYKLDQAVASHALVGDSPSSTTSNHQNTAVPEGFAIANNMAPAQEQQSAQTNPNEISIEQRHKCYLKQDTEAKDRINDLLSRYNRAKSYSNTFS